MYLYTYLLCTCATTCPIPAHLPASTPAQVLGLLSLIVCWGLTSVYLVVSVGLSDWCVEPGGVALEGWLADVFSPRVARYYLRCDSALMSPFTDHLRRAKQSATSVLIALDNVKRVADLHYPREIVRGGGGGGGGGGVVVEECGVERCVVEWGVMPCPHSR